MFRNTAHLYDLVQEFSGKDYDAESAMLTSQISAAVPTAEALLDVACGTGGHLVHLKHHFEVTGIDLDPTMLAEAHRRLPGVDLIEADMRTFDLGRQFDAVVCLFSSVGYLPDRGALEEAIANMARHLSPGGVLIVDGWVRPDAWKEPGSVNSVSGRKDRIAVARVGRSERRGDKTVLELHHLVTTEDGVDHLVDRHELTLFNEDDYLGAFRNAGLQVGVIEGPFADRDRYAGCKPN